MTSPSLTTQLTQYINQKPIELNDLSVAALFVLDAMANAAAGRNTQAGKIILNWVNDKQNDEGRCAFALGALTHIVEMDDLHRTSVTHPGCVIVPAVVAMAGKSSMSGHAILRAVLHGFEACARVGMSVGTEHYKIWHNTATCGPYGSAMAICSLLNLDEHQTVNALGNAGTQSSGFWQFLQTGAMSKHLHAGRAAESGLLSAQLAALGFTGPVEILEGEKAMFAAMCVNPKPDALLADLNAPWQLHQTSIKPWPSCRHTHPVIDAAFEISEQVELQQIESVTIETYQAAVNVCDRPMPQSLYEAKFSLQHCVIAALVQGEISFDSFDQNSRERYAQAANKVSLVVTQDYESVYPDAWGCAVTVKLNTDRTLTVKRHACKGDPDLPLTDSQMLEKADMLLGIGGLNKASANHLKDNILALVNDECLSPESIKSILS